MPGKTDEMTLPCGCEMWTEGDVFFFKPHAMGCPYYRYVLDQGREQGKEMKMMVTDE